MAAPTTGSSSIAPATKVKMSANVQSELKTGIVGEKSLKSLRTYQLGVVYKDEYGRETPVFTSENSSFTTTKELCDNKNAVVVSLKNTLPIWVDTFKFFIKETSNEYYNVCMDRWYDAEDGNIWLSFPSAERNKIQEDTFLILKKKASSQEAVYEDTKYKVIDISNEAPDYIKTDYEKYGEQVLTITEAIPNSSLIKIDFTTGNDSTDWDNSVFYDETLVKDDTTNAATPGVTETGFIGWPLEDVVIDLSITGAATGWLDVANIYKYDANNIYIALSKPLLGSQVDNVQSGGILSVLPAGTGDVTVKMAKKVVKNKSEFNGRFFVKIKRDAVIDDHIRSIGNPVPSVNVQQSIQQYYLNTSSGNSLEAFWKDVGENWFIDEASRGQVGTGTTTNTKGPYPEDDGYGIIGDGAGARTGSAKSNLRCTMELSLNKIKDTNKMGYNVGNNKQANQDFLAKMSKQGTKFRWKEDPYQHIYRISHVVSSADGNTNGDGILNYSSKNSEKKEPKNKPIRLYISFKTTGWRLTADQSTAGATYQFFPEEEGLYPFNYKNEYTPNINATYDAWDPTKYGYGDYNDVSSSYSASYTANQPGTALASLGQNSSFTNSELDGLIYSNTIEIIDFFTGDEEPVFTDNPAVWETEPKEDKGLDIYYEASQAYPTFLDETTNELFAPYGCTVTCKDTIDNKTFYIPDSTVLAIWSPTGHGGNTILLNVKTEEVGIIDNSTALSATNPALANNAANLTFNNLNSNYKGLELRFTRPNGSYTTAKVNYYSGWTNVNNHIDGTSPAYVGNSSDYVLLKLDRNITHSTIKLPYFNCYTFGNGVESDRIRDDFNAVRLDKGVKVSTVLDEPYKEEQRTNGLIYSGIFNSNSGVNNLNQFIAAEKITKDVNPSYGSIQKLKTRDTNLVAFCEDKVLKIIANKDALYNADGNPQLTASNAVLGDVTTFAGEFGISTNPESFAEESFRMYFTDKQRGKVLRLSQDGITPISSMGMDEYFADNLKLSNTLIGSFDDRKGEYNLNIGSAVLSFNEKSKGWVSFKSFFFENGVSINNEYYTFKDGQIWKHHSNETRNNFYDTQYDSHVDVLFNDNSSIVKSFGSMSYEGTQSRIAENLTDNSYHNNEQKTGWYVESGETDLQESGLMEFKEKEGKWFSHMKGASISDIKDLNSSEFNFQGIDMLQSIGDGSGNGDGEGEDDDPIFYQFIIKDLNTGSNYTVSEYTINGLSENDFISPTGTFSSPLSNGSWSSHEIIISPSSGYTVESRDFNISNGNPTVSSPGGSPVTSPPSTWSYRDDTFTGSGGGVSVGTGPYISEVVFMDSENIANDPNWVVTETNTIIVQCIVLTDANAPVTMPNSNVVNELDIRGVARISNPPPPPTSFTITVEDTGDQD
tara:strand:+ start:576 stop:4745 length:4170 start_codon:yes stop_codon:yes gene_type:complete